MQTCFKENENLPRSLEEMAAKGTTKLTTKASTMAASWNAAKSRMQTHYAALPFGPTRKSAFNTGVNAATYRAPDPTKWATNWKAKVSE